MPFPSPSDDDVRRVGQRFISEVSGFTPGLVNLAYETLVTISRPNWAFEWGLSRWVGEAMGLEPEAVESLVLANVYMLAFGRILDDVVDGEHRPSDQGLSHSALTMATLHHLWLSQYANLLAAVGLRGRRFWAYFREYMSEWLGVLMQDTHTKHTFRCYENADWAWLAWQGAPLKVCCAAACIVSEREDAVPPLAAAVDNMMIAVEMLDATFDWLGDLEAGRYNCFVAYCSDLPQAQEHIDRNRRAVLEEIHLGKAAKPYFDLMCGRLARAAEIAAKVPCPGLSDFALSLIDESRSCFNCMVEQATLRMSVAVAAASERDS
jgi:hypothetical protein